MNWKTVIFHMTDLPFGRGGSPLQNLISRGYKSTILSAIACASDIDGGDIYLKSELDLYGTAEEIFLRADRLIESMIIKIIKDKPVAKPQEGNPTFFIRRQLSDSDLAKCSYGDLKACYETIRMLDAEGYPHAFLESHGLKFEFSRVSERSDGLYADVRIIKSSN